MREHVSAVSNDTVDKDQKIAAAALAACRTELNDSNDIAEDTRCLLQRLSGAAELAARQRLSFDSFFADWFLEDSSGGGLAERYGLYARLRTTTEGKVAVEPFRKELRFYADRDDKQRLETYLASLRTTRQSPLIQIQGVDEVSSKPLKNTVVVLQERGLANFMSSLLGHSNRVYTYSVTPKESVQRISNALGSRESVAAVLEGRAPAGGQSVESAMRRSYENVAQRDAIERHSLVVGFADDPGDHRANAARFGWVLGPRYELGGKPGDDVSFRHETVQHSVSAIVAVPSWWKEVSLEVDSYWMRTNGKCATASGTPRTQCAPWPTTAATARATPSASGHSALPGMTGSSSHPLVSPQEHIQVRLPGEPRNLTDILLGTSKRPRIRRQEMDVQNVVPGRAADILIPGSYLWRSSKVILGNQLALSISVLPDMGGIIAHFAAIEEPLGAPVRERQYMRLTVWTSDGKDTVNDRVVLNPGAPPLPPVSPTAPVKVADVAKPVGTKEPIAAP